MARLSSVVTDVGGLHDTVVDVDAETTRKWLDDDYAEALAVEAQTT